MSIDASEYLADPGYFNVSPQEKAPMLIAIAGGASSGKRKVNIKVWLIQLELCSLIGDRFASKADTNVSVLSLHSFYRELSEQEQQLAQLGDLNFDHPSAFDFELLEETLKDLLAGKSVKVPIWDNRVQKRYINENAHRIKSISLVSNTLVQHNARLSEPVPLERVLRQYVKFVKRSHEEFVQPTKQYADIIVPRGIKNKAAITLITEHIASFLQGKDAYVLGEESGRSLLGSDHSTEILGSKDSEFKRIPQ
ncbi:hypothetical protein INT44_008912 [Umbelopsis vinacea]|uniref:Phosphoribulokinase/uridine kinase domain-containing protein n=1 Tax=Umbelopsis vinacea TaxID=44442 RepID=A0A8H7Q3C7_9FUNG|nr:hypothetical protein INT44_008912 [Umbelopsis vinacea]